MIFELDFVLIDEGVDDDDDDDNKLLLGMTWWRGLEIVPEILGELLLVLGDWFDEKLVLLTLDELCEWEDFLWWEGDVEKLCIWLYVDDDDDDVW